MNVLNKIWEKSKKNKISEVVFLGAVFASIMTVVPLAVYGLGQAGIMHTIPFKNVLQVLGGTFLLGSGLSVYEMAKDGFKKNNANEKHQAKDLNKSKGLSQEENKELNKEINKEQEIEKNYSNDKTSDITNDKTI